MMNFPLTSRDQGSENNLMKLDYGIHVVKDKLEFQIPNNSISLKRANDDKFFYKRTGPFGTLEKLISIRTSDLEMEFVPTHPIYTPSYKTDYMFLRLSKPVFVSRNSKTEIFVSIPVEIGLFFTGNKIREYFDVFSCNDDYSRYALYGQPDQGILCKFANVVPEAKVPENLEFVHGRLKVIVNNELDTGVSIGKVVFPIRDHDVYYNKFDSAYDDLEIIIKDRLGVQVVEIVQQDNTGPKKWARSPRTMEKADVKFSMEMGFD